MKRRMMAMLAAAAMLSAASVQTVLACGGPPPMPPPEIWVINHGLNEATGNLEQWVGIEIDLFATQSTGTCACGLGFSNLPPSLDVTMAGIGIVDPDHNVTFLDEFLFELNGQTANDLQGSFGGGPWFGFTAENVPPIDPSTLGLGPEDKIKLWFKTEFDASAIGTVANVTFASGEGLPGGGFNPTLPVHNVAPFTSQDNGLLTLAAPEPTTGVLACLACLAAGLVRRRR
ncbi:MAG: hypothetical protein AAGF31_08340 [Planctomycetota bacterium]